MKVGTKLKAVDGVASAPVKAYLGFKSQPKGFSFSGTYDHTYNGENNGQKTQTHYFEALTAGTLVRTNGEGTSENVSYDVGDMIGINGTVQVNAYIAQIKKGTGLLLTKKGIKKNSKNGQIMQLVDAEVISLGDESEIGDDESDFQP